MKLLLWLQFYWMEFFNYSLYVSFIDHSSNGIEVKLAEWHGPFYMSKFRLQYPRAVFISKQWTQ